MHTDPPRRPAPHTANLDLVLQDTEQCCSAQSDVCGVSRQQAAVCDRGTSMCCTRMYLIAQPDDEAHI